MKCFDVHTHRKPEFPDAAIWNCDFNNYPQIASSTYCSQGLHPWYLDAYQIDSAIDDLRRLLETYPELVAIGECGLDKICNTPWHLQVSSFSSLLSFSYSFHLPLLFPSSPSYHSLLFLLLPPSSPLPFFLPSFRGTPELARQLISCGFYLSYGLLYNEESLQTMPLDRLFLETDESEVPIEHLYQQVATQLGMPLQELAEAVAQNADKVFFSR